MLGSTGKNSQDVSQYPHFVVNQTETLDVSDIYVNLLFLEK